MYKTDNNLKQRDKSENQMGSKREKYNIVIEILENFKGIKNYFIFEGHQ